MSLRVRRLSAIALLFVLCALVTLAGDVPKSADHPLFKRYEGSTIVRYSQKAFDEYKLPVGPVVGRGNKRQFPKVLTLEGRVTRHDLSRARRSIAARGDPELRAGIEAGRIHHALRRRS